MKGMDMGKSDSGGMGGGRMASMAPMDKPARMKELLGEGTSQRDAKAQLAREATATEGGQVVVIMMPSAGGAPIQAHEAAEAAAEADGPTEATMDEVHAAAKARGIDVEDPRFQQACRKATGQRRLDKMNPMALGAVRRGIEAGEYGGEAPVEAEAEAG